MSWRLEPSLRSTVVLLALDFSPSHFAFLMSSAKLRQWESRGSKKSFGLRQHFSPLKSTVTMTFRCMNRTVGRMKYNTHNRFPLYAYANHLNHLYEQPRLQRYDPEA